MTDKKGIGFNGFTPKDKADNRRFLSVVAKRVQAEKSTIELSKIGIA